MAADTYDYCPCGSGNKVKFCCGKDISKEIENLTNSMQGEQYIAAIKSIEQLLEEHGPLPCLYALRGIAFITTGQFEAARENIDQFLKVAPDNSTAWAGRALTSEDEPHKVMEYAQKCLEYASDEMIPQLVVPALQGLVDQLFSVGNAFAGFSHLTLVAAIARNSQQATMKMLQFMQNPDYPLLLKQRLPMPEAPADADWNEAYDNAQVFARRGAWMAALDIVEDLLENAPGETVLLHSIAILNTYLGLEEGIQAWRDYAATIDAGSDAAIEAEAYAQMLNNQSNPDVQAIQKLTYKVDNLDLAQELLVANSQARMVPDPGFGNDDPDNPPPRSLFVLTDKAQLDTGVDVTMEQIPIAVATLYLFGKQTDRDARVELVLANLDGEDAATTALQTICGNELGELEDTSDITEVPVLADALSWNPVFPEDTPQELMQQLSLTQREDGFRDIFPTLKLQAFDGRTAEELALDFNNRVKVQATLMIIETNLQCRDYKTDLNYLREKLGLAQLEPIDPTDVELSQITDVQLGRYDVTKMSTDQLAHCYQRCLVITFRKAIVAIAEEIITRDDKPQHLNLADVYGSLLETRSTNEERIDLIEKAKQAALAANQSPAIWLLREIPLRIMSGDTQTASDLMQTIEANHIEEPGIRDHFYQLLMQLGIINPDGSPAGGQAQPGIIDPSASAPQAGGVWTPGNQEPPANNPSASGDENPGLWIPD
jgi:tetratricopeptide (TPR) repeat protein